MNLVVSQAQGRVPVTIIQVDGDLDGSSYQALIDKGSELCKAGACYMVVDLTKTPYMSSAGLVALHSLALMLRGEPPPDPQSGWEAYRAIARDQDKALPQPLKLLNPQPKVGKVLTTTGFSAFLEIHTDLASAIASF